jgi:hypothetical protein
MGANSQERRGRVNKYTPLAVLEALKCAPAPARSGSKADSQPGSDNGCSSSGWAPLLQRSSCSRDTPVSIPDSLTPRARARALALTLQFVQKHQPGMCGC